MRVCVCANYHLHVRKKEERVSSCSSSTIGICVVAVVVDIVVSVVEELVAHKCRR